MEVTEQRQNNDSSWVALSSKLVCGLCTVVLGLGSVTRASGEALDLTEMLQSDEQSPLDLLLPAIDTGITALPAVKEASRFAVDTFVVSMPQQETGGAERPAEGSTSLSEPSDPGRMNRNLLDQDGLEIRKPEVVNGRFELPTLAAATINTSEVGNGRTPEGFRTDSPASVYPLPESGIDRDSEWGWTVRTWAAPNTFSNPRYFEDRMLERHGHERFGHWTPLASGARFFATVPMLPYLATVQKPCECEYTLGYFRSGNCVPAYLQRPPYERKAVVAEAAAITTAVLIVP